MSNIKPIPLIPLNVKERIENSIISKESCWLTNYSKNSKKPSISIEGVRYLLTRVIYKLYKGKDPGELYVCHTCDNPRCINPDHLWLGTCADNMADKKNKNRQTKGSIVPSSKLTEEKVIEIKKLLIENKLTLKEIKNRFGVGNRTISEINSGKRWSHVEGVGTKIRTTRGGRKLSFEQAEKIKKLLLEGMTCTEVGQLFGVSRWTVQSIRQGKTWSLLETKELKKLNTEQVKEIKNMLSNNISCAEISRLFGVSRKAIENIKHGKSWSYLN
jgi:DNA-binding CsgD family transcriptional regulator